MRVSLGTIQKDNQVKFTLQCEREDRCRILLVSKDNTKEEWIQVPVSEDMGNLRCCTVTLDKPEDWSYLLEINGKLCQDPYARAIVGRDMWNQPESESGEETIRCGFIRDSFDWGEDKRPEIPKKDMFIYKLHVRGFSMALKSGKEKKGTFAAVGDKIDYLKDMGVTTVEFMPVYEFEEAPAQGNLNYWGYGPGRYFAVKASYGSVPEQASQEWKSLIKQLHENQMEAVMEMYFPDDTDHNLILDALLYWAKEYHIDGFHLLGNHLPINAIVHHPLLARVKLFAGDFHGMTSGRNYKNLFIYKEEYQYPARQLLNHYAFDVGEFVNQQRKQSEEYGFVNYLASNNGFTLADVFMYNDKHNEDNGEGNKDGTDYNLSSNCGAEGPSRKRSIREIRKNNTLTAMMMLFLAQGIPMIQAGDECGNSQKGNNNAYCQDNAIGWVDWSLLDSTGELRELIKKLMEFRKKHPVIVSDSPYRFHDYLNKGAPDLSYHGESAWLSQLDPGKKSVGMFYNGEYGPEGADKTHIYIGYNFYSEETPLALPSLNGNRKKEQKEWIQVLPEEKELADQRYLTVKPYQVCVLIGR